MAFVVHWANYPNTRDANASRFNKHLGRPVPAVANYERSLGRAFACCAFMDSASHLKPSSFKSMSSDFQSSADTVRQWLTAAVDSRSKGLPPDIAKAINVHLDQLQGQIKIAYGASEFGKKNRFFGKKNRLWVRYIGFEATPLRLAALGIALIADLDSEWRFRVGRCLYHRERFVFNETVHDGERGPMRTFYCTKGCAVQLSRAERKKKEHKALTNSRKRSLPIPSSEPSDPGSAGVITIDQTLQQKESTT